VHGDKGGKKGVFVEQKKRREESVQSSQGGGTGRKGVKIKKDRNAGEKTSLPREGSLQKGTP